MNDIKSEINLAELVLRLSQLEQRVEELERTRKISNKVITTTAPASTKAYIKRMGDKK